MWSLFKRSAKPTAAQKEMVEDLMLFKEELVQHRLNLATHQDSAVRLMVEFFNSTSRRQDQDLASQLAALKGDSDFRRYVGELNRHLHRTGRNSCGMNRTEFGYPVRNVDVYLGGLDDYNVLTRNVETILRLEDKAEEFSVYNLQAAAFLTGNTLVMIETINNLLNSQVVAEILEN